MEHYAETNLSYNNDSLSSNYSLYKDYKDKSTFVNNEKENLPETGIETETNFETELPKEKNETILNDKPVIHRRENSRVLKENFDIFPFITGGCLAYLAHDKFITKKYSWAYVAAAFTIGYLGGNFISRIVNKK